jgi:hypothetical protein
VTSLDVCDELGLSGLTISSDDNCLVITGNVSFEYDLGNYKGGAGDHVYQNFANANNGNHYSVVDDIGFIDTNGGDVDTWLKFVGTANSDFGPASATIKLISENINGEKDQTVGIDQAWVGIGDTTMLMAGYKDSIFNKSDDVPLNYLGLFNSESVNTGVLWSAALKALPGEGAGTGGDVIQVVSNLGNGISVGAGLENLGGGNITGVGVLSYAGDGVTAHVSAAVDGNAAWKVHAGFTGAWDPIKVVGAVAADSTGYYDALGSVAATFDMFTLAVSGEAALDGYGVGGSIGATVTDGVTLNLGGRYWNGTASTHDTYQVEAGISAAVTETITLTGAVGVTDGDDVSTPYNPDPFAFYGKAGVAWAPGGGFTSSSNVTVSSLGGYKWVFKAAKSIK